MKNGIDITSDSPGITEKCGSPKITDCHIRKPKRNKEFNVIERSIKENPKPDRNRLNQNNRSQKGEKHNRKWKYCTSMYQPCQCLTYTKTCTVAGR